MARMEKYRIQSAGAAYTLDIGFDPDTIEVWNYTKWATDATKVKFYWHKGMTTDYGLSELCEDTSTNHAIEAANGFTVLATTSVTTNRQTISAMTAADPGVFTVTSTSGWTTGDKVRIRNTNVTEINDNLYNVVVIDSTTFSLQTIADVDVNTTAYTVFAAGTNLNYAFNISKKVDNEGAYRVTLGSTIMANNDDIFYVECRQADNYTNKGDVA